MDGLNRLIPRFLGPVRPLSKGGAQSKLDNEKVFEMLLAIFVLSFGLVMDDSSEGLQLLKAISKIRTVSHSTEKLNGKMIGHSRGVKDQEISFEAARTTECESVVTKEVFPDGREKIDATLLRPDISYRITKEKNDRVPRVTTLPSELQESPVVFLRQAGMFLKELHGILFDDHFFREFVNPVISQENGCFLVDFQRMENGEFKGSFFFDETAIVSRPNRTVDFTLSSLGILKEYSYPLTYEGDPKKYPTTIQIERQPDGVLRTVKQIYSDNESVGYVKTFSIQNHTYDQPLPDDQFSLTRFGLQEKQKTVPMIWLVFAGVASASFIGTVVWYRYFSQPAKHR